MKKSLLIFLVLAAAAAVIIPYFLLKPAPGKIHYYKVLCMGDSLTESSYGQYPRSLKRLFKTGNMKVNVYTAAGPGNTSGEYLNYIKGTDILKKIKPHIVILMLGTNDVRIDGDHTPVKDYVKNMREIIAIIKNHGHPGDREAMIFLSTIPPIFHCDLPTFDETSQQRIGEEIVPAINLLAKEENLRLIDLYGFFEKKPELLPGIHPGKEGYRAMAELMFANLRPYIK